MPETISLINQERSNNKLYVSLLHASPTAYFDDKTLPSALERLTRGLTSIT